MNRILLIAKRDYLQTILSKAYLFGLVIFPVLMGCVFLALSLVNKGNGQERRIIVIDHTGLVASAVIDAARVASGRVSANIGVAGPAGPAYAFKEIKPEGDDSAQVMSLGAQIRTGDIFVLLDIPAGALAGNGDPVRYYTGSSGLNALGLWFPNAVNEGLRHVRLTQAGMDDSRAAAVLAEVPVVSTTVPARDPGTGKILPGEKKNLAQSTTVAYVLVMLLYLVVMVGAAPQISAVAEDKMQRVFEMLLSSATAFELMAGKVLACLAVSLTSSVLYIAGGTMVLISMALFGIAPFHLLPWFFVYLVADIVMLSALGVALGSACSSPRDAQQLAFLLILPLVIPVSMLTPVSQQPNGPFATMMSLIPPFTPVLMLMRQALPGGVPEWQPWAGLLGVFLWAFGMVWASARVFRIGILAQGKTPKIGELVQWVVRG